MHLGLLVTWWMQLVGRPDLSSTRIHTNRKSKGSFRHGQRMPAHCSDPVLNLFLPMYPSRLTLSLIVLCRPHPATRKLSLRYRTCVRRVLLLSIANSCHSLMGPFTITLVRFNNDRLVPALQLTSVAKETLQLLTELTTMLKKPLRTI